jgi:hypothetical protein
MKEGINMENNKLERLIFKLLRIFGVLSIIGGFLGEEALHQFSTIRIGHVVFISVNALIGIIVSITIYLVFLRIVERHISITKKNI